MALDDADKKFITDLLAASLKAQDEATKAHVQTVVTGAVKAIDEKQEKASQAAAAAAKAKADADKVAADAAAGAGGGGADGGKSAKVDPELARLKERLEAQERATAAATKQAADEKAARENAEIDGAMRDELVKQGVPADRVKFVLATMKAEGKVRRTTDGAPGLYFKRTSAAGNYDDILPMADGVKEWLGTTEGKTFLPPTEQKGAGGGPGSGSGAKPGVITDMKLINVGL